jgi:hypothetical protein
VIFLDRIKKPHWTLEIKTIKDLSPKIDIYSTSGPTKYEPHITVIDTNNGKSKKMVIDVGKLRKEYQQEKSFEDFKIRIGEEED